MLLPSDTSVVQVRYTITSHLDHAWTLYSRPLYLISRLYSLLKTLEHLFSLSCSCSLLGGVSRVAHGLVSHVTGVTLQISFSEAGKRGNWMHTLIPARLVAAHTTTTTHLVLQPSRPSTTCLCGVAVSHANLSQAAFSVAVTVGRIQTDAKNSKNICRSLVSILGPPGDLIGSAGGRRRTVRSRLLNTFSALTGGILQ